MSIFSLEIPSSHLVSTDNVLYSDDFSSSVIMSSSVNFSCSNNVKSSKNVNDSFDYSQLDVFINDSVEKPIILNQNFIENFNSWELVRSIESTMKIKDNDTETFPFVIESIALELDKIKFENAPEDLNIPQIIGRFRVYKTNILKINSIDLSSDNFVEYKNSLKKLISSHNALVNMLNLRANELEQESLIIQD